MSPDTWRRTTYGKSEIDGPVGTLPTPDLVDPGHVPVAHVRIPGVGRPPGCRAEPPALGGDAQQPWAQLPDLPRARRRRPVRVPAGGAALSRDPLGQRL